MYGLLKENSGPMSNALDKTPWAFQLSKRMVSLSLTILSRLPSSMIILKSVFTQEDDILPQLPPTSFPPIPNITVSVSGVTKLLSDLNPHKATGPDGIPARILKVAAEEIASALSIIFQKSLETGEIPSSWLRANVSPMFKKEIALTHPITVPFPSPP